MVPEIYRVSPAEELQYAPFFPPPPLSVAQKPAELNRGHRRAEALSGTEDTTYAAGEPSLAPSSFRRNAAPVERYRNDRFGSILVADTSLT